MRLALVQLRRQANQVLYEHECAHGNKSGYADGEQSPRKMNLRGAGGPRICSGPAPTCYLLVAGASAAVLF